MERSQDPYEHVRRQLLDALLEKLEEDTYPSGTMMDTVEEMLTPQDVPRYAQVLLGHVQEDRFPSTSMISRLQRLAEN